MTKYTHLALLCTVVVLGLLISPVMAIEAAPGEHIYRGFDRAQDRPDIDGDRIVWQDDRNGNNDIYLGTVGDFRRSLGSYTGERITTDPASQAMPSISGNYIVWQDSRNGNSDIYLYDISTREERPLTNDSGYQWLPIVRGNYAAWYDNSTGKTNIVLYDIGAGAVKAVIEANAKTTIPFSTVGTEFRPALSERYLAWVNESDSGERLWYYDIEAGSVVGRVSTTATSPLYQSWPSLSGSLIAWRTTGTGLRTLRSIWPTSTIRQRQSGGSPLPQVIRSRRQSASVSSPGRTCATGHGPYTCTTSRVMGKR